MAKDFSRIQRVNSVVQRELAKIIQLEFHDELPLLVTITGVKVSPDLSFAKVYVVTHDDAQIDEVLQFLNNHAKHIRYQLGKEVKLRKLPELRFYFDESIGRGARISELLINEE